MKMSNHYVGHNFKHIFDQITADFLKHAHPVHPLNWQGQDVSKRREMTSYELMNVTLSHPIDNYQAAGIEPEGLAVVLGSNWPWCEDHFQERVCGYPINPGTEWQNWPWNRSASTFLSETGRFNHNYMERYWPKYAGGYGDPVKYASELEGQDLGQPLHGIRNEYGDLNDLVDQLIADPYNRQSWIPIFHPEDVGEVVGGRKPCTLGYQFLVRNGKLHVWYPLRSCDFIRHFRDDIYLTIRLAQWVLEQCKTRGILEDWDGVTLGSYSMHCTSLHVFTNDYIQMGGRP